MRIRRSTGGHRRVGRAAMATNGDPTEVELKLRIPPAALPRLIKHRALTKFRQGPPKRQRLVSTYFDTPDLALMRAQVALRVRKVGERRIQTLKLAATPETGPLSRREWEREVAQDQPDLTGLTDRDLRRVVNPSKIGRRLKAMFTTDFQRRTWPLKVKDTTIELALDVGEIKSADRSLPVCEAELELKSGTVDRIYELARELRRSVPFVIEPLTKAERGYALATNVTPTAHKAQAIILHRRSTAGEAFLRIGRNGLMHLATNAAAVRAGSAAEAIHQLRVAVRRLRSALSVFKDLLPADEQRRIGTKLRRIAQECATAREWDVFQDELLSPLRDKLPDEPALGAFAEAVAAARKDADGAVGRLVGSPRYSDTILEVEAWWEGTGWAAHARELSETPVSEFARVRLKRLLKRLCKLGDRIGNLEEAELHELRIRAKKLRYACEFFRSLFPGKVTRHYIAGLAEIQDHLGALNDAVTVRHLLKEIDKRAPDMDPAVLSRAGGLITGWNSAKIEGDLKELPAVWSAFSELKPFWK